MPIDESAASEQARLWNGSAGEAWVAGQAMLDRMFEPIERLLVDSVRRESATRVLDIGCGTGATTLAVARMLGAGGSCTGVDISEPMIALARTRAEREGLAAQFVRADAADHGFAPDSFDMLVSRFGVMFFDDPVAAFANLRRAARSGGALRLIAWRSAGENPFMTTAERAAAPLLPGLPPRRADAPGQFAFADASRVRALLAESGWTAIDIEPVDIACAFPEPALDAHLGRMGPLGLALRDMDEPARAAVLAAVRPAFAPFVAEDEVRFTAACWSIGARAPG